MIWGIQASARAFHDQGTKGAIINASSIAGHERFAMLVLRGAVMAASGVPRRGKFRRVQRLIADTQRSTGGAQREPEQSTSRATSDQTGEGAT